MEGLCTLLSRIQQARSNHANAIEHSRGPVVIRTDDRVGVCFASGLFASKCGAGSHDPLAPGMSDVFRTCVPLPVERKTFLEALFLSEQFETAGELARKVSLFFDGAEELMSSSASPVLLSQDSDGCGTASLGYSTIVFPTDPRLLRTLVKQASCLLDELSRESTMMGQGGGGGGGGRGGRGGGGGGGEEIEMHNVHTCTSTLSRKASLKFTASLHHEQASTMHMHVSKTTYYSTMYMCTRVQ